MRVLIINAESGYGGGPAIIANGISRIVNENGGDSVVAYGRQGDPNSGIKIYSIKNNVETYFHVLLTRIFDAHGLGSHFATQKLLNYIDDYKPDVINLHNIHGYYISYVELFKYINKHDIPVVWTFHDCWAFTGHCAYFDRACCDKWKTQCNKCPQKKHYPRALLLDSSRKNFIRKKELFSSVQKMTIVTPSNWLKSIVEMSFLNKYPCKTIHNGIDLSKYYPLHSDWKKNNIPQNKKMILAVAAAWEGERKGLSDLLKVALDLKKEYTLVVVGLTEDQVKSLPPYVIGIKRTENREELVKIYTAADVFVNASIEDNFPTVILEALACGTPVVTYDTGGSKESLDSTCGRIVEQGNIDKMIEAIEDITSKGDLSEYCLNRISQFDHIKKYGEYFELFNQMMK